ncbi:DUF2294 domain-containing protein [Calditrichota bacterium]
MQKSKGQIEEEISKSITKFEKEHLGRGPIEVKTYILDDIILIRLKGILTTAEKRLAKENDGAQIIKQIRRRLIESSRPLLEEIINNITGENIKSLHTDISSRTGERIFVLCLGENLQRKIEYSK